MNIVTMIGDKQVRTDLADRVRMEAVAAMQATRILEGWEQARNRPVDAPDRPTVQRAMEAVESRLVEALWTLARISGDGGGGRCGLAYIHDAADRFSNAVANGGKWEETRPRPSLPSPKAIDAMYEPLEWLTFLPSVQGKLVSTAAGTKRGDVGRGVSWNRVRDALPETRTLTIRTLQRRYDAGIRVIVGELTERAFLARK